MPHPCTDSTFFTLTVDISVEPWYGVVRRGAYLTINNGDLGCTVQDPSVVVPLDGSVTLSVTGIEGHSVPWSIPGGTANAVTLETQMRLAAGFSTANLLNQTLNYGIGVSSQNARWNVDVDGPFQAASPAVAGGTVATTDSSGDPLDISSPLVLNTEITFTATPGAGLTFSHWVTTVATVDGEVPWTESPNNTDSPRTITLDRNYILTSVYSGTPPPSVTGSAMVQQAARRRR